MPTTHHAPRHRPPSTGALVPPPPQAPCRQRRPRRRRRLHGLRHRQGLAARLPLAPHRRPLVRPRGGRCQQRTGRRRRTRPPPRLGAARRVEKRGRIGPRLKTYTHTHTSSAAVSVSVSVSGEQRAADAVAILLAHARGRRRTKPANISACPYRPPPPCRRSTKRLMAPRGVGILGGI